MAQEKLVCVNVDLDAIPHYLGIHGMGAQQVSEEVQNAVCRKALPRFLELFESLSIHATFFAVGSDLADALSAQNISHAAQIGHEIGNHTSTHPYGLTKLSNAALTEEIVGGEEAIFRAVGIRPTGFRAPGYAIHAPLMKCLESRGYTYDSSAFPAAPYYLAKACIMGLLKLRGRPSAAILDRPVVLASPLSPYRPDVDEPYRKGPQDRHHFLWEMPLSLEKRTRIPLIGTSALLFPEAAVRWLTQRLQKESWVNFELHGIDLLDDSDLGLDGLSAVQRELRIPVKAKMARLKNVLKSLCEGGSQMTLAQAASQLNRPDCPHL